MGEDSLWLLLHNLALAFDRKSWHGANLAGSIRGLTPADAAWRPSQDRHSIHDLVVHCAYWKYTVRRRLMGEQRGRFYRTGSNFFSTAPEEWKQDVAALRSEHRLLMEVVATLAPQELDTFPTGSTHNVRDIVLGVASHDLYHAGQIQLLKRLRAGSSQPS